MKRMTIRELTFAAVLAAVYAGLTLYLPGQYGPIQVRVAEALTVLPFFFPAAIPGLTVESSTNWNKRYQENLLRLKSGKWVRSLTGEQLQA